MTARPAAASSDGRRPRAVFFGSGAFGLPALRALRAAPLRDVVELVGVVSVPDRPAGRAGHPTAVPAAAAAAELGLPVVQPARLRDPEAVAAVAALGADVAILADYGRLVPAAILATPRRGFLNLHPSLLPRHRGATPVAGTILAGDAEAGVTLFEMDAGLDTGPIVAQASWRLGGYETTPELEARAARAAAALLASELGPWLAGARPARAQDDAAATLTRPWRREDGRLDPALGAAALERRVRALAPWPGTFIETASGRLSVRTATVAAPRPGDAAGRLVGHDDGLALTTAAGRLVFVEVQPAGGRPMAATDYRRGHPSVVDATVREASPLASGAAG